MTATMTMTMTKGFQKNKWMEHSQFPWDSLSVSAAEMGAHSAAMILISLQHLQLENNAFELRCQQTSIFTRVCHIHRLHLPIPNLFAEDHWSWHAAPWQSATASLRTQWCGAFCPLCETCQEGSGTGLSSTEEWHMCVLSSVH